MILFLLVGGIAVFCQLHNHGGLLVDAGILLGIIGIIMAMDRGKLFVERLKGKKAAKEKEEGKKEGGKKSWRDFKVKY